MKTAALLLAFIVVVALAAGLSLLMAFPTVWMVNYLFTSQALITLFGTAKIGFWQAFVLNMLCGSLFKNTTYSGKKD